MTNTGPSFYKTGGTLSPDEPSYVARHADEELHRRLAEGQFCYVLTSRQMGKSSLMNKVSTRLHREGVAVADIDLTTIGQNLSAEQWYDGLIYEIGRSLNLKSQLRASWQANAELGPLQRFIVTMRDALLTTFFQPVVIFVDEIEVVSGLGFSTDEFFAAIRECYNRRASDPEMRRLTFCLLGMATPQDLVRDPRITPFNIGHRIDLADFTYSEALPLAAGMCDGGRDGNRLLRRVLHWTHGQPYLTQRLCQAVAEDQTAIGDLGVDRLCRELFLSERAREGEPNLVPLREYVLRSAPDRAALLDTYQKVLTGKRVVNDGADVNISILQLSGFTRAERGFLRARNRIYAQVFDRSWIRTNMPDAELRRQKAAFWRAFTLNAAVFGSITAIAVAAAIIAFSQNHQARREQHRTSALLYVADLKIADQALKSHNVDQVLDLLRAHAGDPMAGFEYGYLWLQCNRDWTTVRSSDQFMCGVAFSPDNRYAACASVDGQITIIDVTSKKEIRRLRSDHITPYANVVFDPIAARLAAITCKSVTVWNTRNWSVSHNIPAPGFVSDIGYRHDGARLAIACGRHVTLFDTTTWKRVTTIDAVSSGLCLKLSPTTDDLATAGSDGVVRVWDTSTGRLKHMLTGHSAAIRALAFDSAGATLVASGEDNLITEWNTRSWVLKRGLPTGDESEYALAYIPGTNLVAAGGSHTAVELWDTGANTVEDTFDGHSQSIRSLACSSDGNWLASASWDCTAKLWNLRQEKQTTLPCMPNATNNYALSQDGAQAIGLLPGNSLGIWDASTGQPRSTFRLGYNIGAMTVGAGGQIALANNRRILVFDETGRVLWKFAVGDSWVGVNSVAVAPDGKSVAVGGLRGELQIWRFPGKLERSIVDRPPGLTVSALTFSPNGEWLAAGSHSGAVLMYPIDARQVPKSLLGHHGDITGLAFSHSGRELATSGADDSVKIWNLDTDREVLTLDTGNTQCSSLAFGANDLALEMAGYDGRLQVWHSMSAADAATALRKAP